MNISGYLGALRAGLTALAPNADFVPLREAQVMLDALDPSISGDLAAPSAIDTSGMPSLPWLLRANGALAVAEPVSTEELVRARRLDPVIADRMEARSRLAELRRLGALPTSRLLGAVRRQGPTTDFLLTFDRLTPEAHWIRTRVDLTGPAGWEKAGPIQLNDDTTVRLDDGLSHLLGRHLHTPIGALCLQLQDGTGALVTRLSRGTVGPFWFPGCVLPDGVPTALSAGLVLHGAREILGREVLRSTDNDPLHALRKERDDILPPGVGLVRERRFAASPHLVQPLRSWAESLGCAVTVAPLR